jgi:hypothetical protein
MPQAERQRRWYLGLTEEQREARRIRQRIENMTPEQISRKRVRNSRHNMTPGRQSKQIGYQIRSRLRAAGYLKEG